MQQIIGEDVFFNYPESHSSCNLQDGTTPGDDYLNFVSMLWSKWQGFLLANIPQVPSFEYISTTYQQNETKNTRIKNCRNE